ncbi:hypothetical protein M405DRAFT_832716, partial [Rhizopogon salebrosus TDB-379]
MHIGFDDTHTLSQRSGKRDANLVVFASTTLPEVDFIPPPHVIYNFVRFPGTCSLLYPPYTRLGWTEGINGIMMIATRNLCNSVTFDAADMNQVLHVLSQRFGLDAVTLILALSSKGC